MKKIFIRLMAVITACTVGFTATSCGKDDVINALEQVLNVWLALQQGQTVNYIGSASMERLAKNSAGQYAYTGTNGGMATTASLQASVNVGTGGTATISVGSFTVGGVTISNLKISNVTYADGKLGSNEYTYPYTCTYTLNNQSTNLESTQDNIDVICSFIDGTITSSNNSSSLNLKSTIYINNEAINLNYVGNYQSATN